MEFVLYLILNPSSPPHLPLSPWAVDLFHIHLRPDTLGSKDGVVGKWGRELLMDSWVLSETPGSTLSMTPLVFPGPRRESLVDRPEHGPELGTVPESRLIYRNDSWMIHGSGPLSFYSFRSRRGNSSYLVFLLPPKSSRTPWFLRSWSVERDDDK